MLLETADGEEDAEGKADDDKSKDETDFQVEQSAVQFCTISFVDNWDFILNYQHLRCSSGRNSLRCMIRTIHPNPSTP